MAILRDDIDIQDVHNRDFYIYKRGGRTVLAMRNPHSRDRVLGDKKFEQTRKHASDMARAAVLASKLYQQLPPGRRQHSLYREMTGVAATMLYNGLPGEVVQEKLHDRYL
jgi:hypothetical protein